MPSSLAKIQNIPKNQRSFTLIELLIVIAILALLMSAVIVTLNPTEMLRKTRDTRRITDLNSLNKALGIFSAVRPTASTGSASTVYISLPDSTSTCANLGLPALPTGYAYQCSTTQNYRNTDGTGWIPINFNSLDTGSPLSSLAIDPVNATTSSLYYTYVTGGSWELNAILESKKNRLSGDDDKTSTDGGDSYSTLEIGTNLTLSPINDSGLAGYWKMDGGTSGSIANNQTTGLKDASGQSNNGTAKNANGTGMAWTGGQLGDAVSFGGVDDYIDIANSTSLNITNAITIVAWMNASVKPSNATGHYWHIISEKVSAYTLAMYYNGKIMYGGPGWTSDTSKRYYSTAVSYNVNEWHQVAVTYDSTSGLVYFYFDDSPEGSISATIGSSANDLYIGKGASGYLWNGYLDDVRIYNRALSAAEIKAIYDATK